MFGIWNIVKQKNILNYIGQFDIKLNCVKNSK